MTMSNEELAMSNEKRELIFLLHAFFDLRDVFVFLVIVMSRRKMSLQSLIMLVYSVSLIKLVSLSRSSQYSVSAHSFSDIVALSRKSFLLMAYWASVRFAPIEVPERSICFAKTYSCFSSQRYLFRLYILIANFLLFSSAMFIPIQLSVINGQLAM